MSEAHGIVVNKTGIRDALRKAVKRISSVREAALVVIVLFVSLNSWR